MVFHTPEFIQYFGQATPGQELGSLNIGRAGSTPLATSFTLHQTLLSGVKWHLMTGCHVIHHVLAPFLSQMASYDMLPRHLLRIRPSCRESNGIR